MIIILKSNATLAEREGIIGRIEELGFKPNISEGAEHTVIGVVGSDRGINPGPFEALPGVDRIIRVLKPYKLASREFQAASTKIELPGGVTIGGSSVAVMAGPCAVESKELLLEAARGVKSRGAHMLRGGAFKPRTSPYAFQGLAEEGLRYLAEARAETGLPIVTEVMTPNEVELVARYADVLQIGARNMQNYQLLREVGSCNKPVMIKRGLSATLEELCLAAEYVLAQGNRQVMFCERGIRTFEKATRNTLDLSAVPLLKEWSHLPVIVDPSHSTGKRSLVPSMALAAIAAGADGLIIEVHPQPERAMSDGPQSLTFDLFAKLMEQAKVIAAAVGRTL